MMPGVKQVDGNHYSGSDYQHWDWADDVRLPYLESAATKYLCRWKDKNGLVDIEKSISYLQKRLVQIYAGPRENDCWHVEEYHSTPVLEDAMNCFRLWVKESQIEPEEAAICLQIAKSRTEQEVRDCIDVVRALLERHKGAAATPTPGNPATATGGAKTGAAGAAGGAVGQGRATSLSVGVGDGQSE